MKKTMTVFSALMLIALLSACGTAPTATVTTDGTNQSTDSVQTTTVKEGGAPEVTAEEKSPSVDEGDLYFKAIESGDVKMCAQLTSDFLKEKCNKELTKNN